MAHYTTADGYCVQNGSIITPGKFEGEPEYAPTFWNESYTADFYDGDTPVSVREIDADDRQCFPELENVYAVILWESDQGFVYTRELLTAEELTQVETACDDSDETDENEDCE